MKCPVCDQENSTMLCTRCGFDSSRDYEKYPTFSLIGDSIPTKQIRRQEERKTSGVVDEKYLRELIHKCSEALVKIDAQQGEIRSLQLRFQNAQEELRKAQQELRKAQQENAQFQVANSKLITENDRLTKHIHTQSTMLDARADRINMLLDKINKLKLQSEEQIAELTAKNSSCQKESDTLRQNKAKLRENLSIIGKRLEAANKGIAALRLEAKDRDETIAFQQNEINRLQKLLEEEQNKSLLSRIFNR